MLHKVQSRSTDDCNGEECDNENEDSDRDENGAVNDYTNINNNANIVHDDVE